MTGSHVNLEMKGDFILQTLSFRNQERRAAQFWTVCAYVCVCMYVCRVVCACVCLGASGYVSHVCMCWVCMCVTGERGSAPGWAVSVATRIDAREGSKGLG